MDLSVTEKILTTSQPTHTQRLMIATMIKKVPHTNIPLKYGLINADVRVSQIYS